MIREFSAFDHFLIKDDNKVQQIRNETRGAFFALEVIDSMYICYE